MATKVTLGLALLLLHPIAATAHVDPLRIKRAHHDHAIYARQSASSAPSVSSASSTPSVSSASSSSSVSAASSASGASTGSLSISSADPTPTDPSIPPLSAIVSGMPSPSSLPLSVTFTPGALPPISGAPPLPTAALDKSKYPPPTQVAPTDTPQVTQWLKELEGHKIPDIPPTTDQAICSSNAEAAADRSRCWWTCGGCTRDSDVVNCPTKLDWGVSFDDGPSPYTPKILDYLHQEKFNATFFVVGSSIYWRPDILQAEYMAGHQISVHTWFHQHLTTLNNAQIVAELGYTRQIIKDVTGVTPNTFRPPYGDIDDRVRAIALAMGLQPIIWTRDKATGAQFDTNDWLIPAGSNIVRPDGTSVPANGKSSFDQFSDIIKNGTSGDIDTGIIVLQHDLYWSTVALATGFTLPYAKQRGFNRKSINECLSKDPKEVYQETATNKTLLTLNTNWTGNFIDGEDAASSSVSGSGSTGGGSGSGGSNQGSGANRLEIGAGIVVGGALVMLFGLVA